jgi:hypothetical protein
MKTPLQAILGIPSDRENALKPLHNTDSAHRPGTPPGADAFAATTSVQLSACNWPVAFSVDFPIILYR